MATKKAGSAKKTSTRSKSQSKTNVSTVKAVAAVKSRSSLLSGRNSVLAAALIGEFIGTFLLAGAFLVTRGEPLYLGFVLVGLMMMVGTLSGGHLNPVITVGAWVTRKIGHLRALGYVVAQLLGAAAAYVVLSSFMGANQPDAAASAFAQQAPEVFKMAVLTDQNHWYVLFAELLGASVFAFAFAGVWREKADRVARSVQVGFAFFIAALVAGVAASYVKANVALNPAVALTASAVDFNKIDWFAVAVYVATPLIGGVVGFALRDVVEANKK